MSTTLQRRSVGTMHAIIAVIILTWVASARSESKSLKVLTIGNSFSGNATAYLDGIASAEGDSILIGRASLAGASFERHVKGVKAFEADPADPVGSPYKSNFTPIRQEPTKRYSLKDLLEAERWDVVTIQQASKLSNDYETYEPFAGFLVGYVQKYAPQAEIMVHQTWAYREDSPGFSPDGLTQEKMYEGLTDAYTRLAKQYNLRIIPVGYAFQLTRRSVRWHFAFPDPDFDYKQPPADTLPQQKGSLNLGWIRGKDEDGTDGFHLDSKHANVAGKYLAGLVWYETIFAKKVGEQPFLPKNLDPSDAEDLRTRAHTAIKDFPASHDKSSTGS